MNQLKLYAGSRNLTLSINRTETILTLNIDIKNGKTNTREKWNTELYWLISYFEYKLCNENR